MANDFYTPEQAALVSAKLVGEDAFLSALVSKNAQDEFLQSGKAGAPVGVKIPTTLIAREREIADTTSSIVLDEIVEQRKTFELSAKMDYIAVPLSEADLNLNLTDFGSQVLGPQTAAIADQIEHKLATKLLSVPVTALSRGGAPVVFDADPIAYFTALRKQLRDNGVSADGLNVAVGTEVYAKLLDAKAITDVSESGSTAALRDAGIGKIRGFSIVESTRLDEDEILAFHKDAVTLITRAPAVPQGASFGASASAGGFSMRYLRDYDAMKTVDRSIVATFSAVGILPTFKIGRNYETREVTVTEIENGGVLHLSTASA